MTAAARIAAISAAYEAQRQYVARTKGKGGKAVRIAQLRQDIRDVWEEHGPHLLPLLQESVRRNVIMPMINGERE